RIIEISQPGDDPLRPVVQIREREPQGLNPYERRIFDRLVRAAPDGRLVPLHAVAGAYAPEGVWWWGNFRREGRTGAKKQEYTDGSWFSWSTAILLMGAFWVAMLVAVLVMLPFTGTAAWVARDPDRAPQPPEGLPMIAFGCVCVIAVLACVFYLLHYH